MICQPDRLAQVIVLGIGRIPAEKIPTWRTVVMRASLEPTITWRRKSGHNFGGELKIEGLGHVMARETDIKGAADFGMVVLIADGVTDASDGLDATLARVEAKVPHAKIVKILHHLVWA